MIFDFSVSALNFISTVGYIKKIGVLHLMPAYVLKCKQTTDMGNMQRLKETLPGFAKPSFAKKPFKELKIIAIGFREQDIFFEVDVSEEGSLTPVFKYVLRLGFA